MRVSMLDPSAFTPPYDHALARSLARAGVEVELITSRFLYGPVPETDGYEVTEAFYRRTAARGLDAPGRRIFKAGEHLLDMAALWRRPEPDVVHHQWLTMPAIDTHLISRRRPSVITAHYILAPDPSRRQLGIARRMYGQMDAVIAHSQHGARRLREEVGVEPGRIHVIHHGAFDYLTALPEEKPLPDELAGAEGPVVLFFGLLRPYKGVDLLLEAFRQVRGAELWIVGNPRMPVEPLLEAAELCSAKVRFVTRFIDEDEIPALFRRADIAVLPYLDAEHSGVIYTGLAFGTPMVASSVGGFPELAGSSGAIRIVEPGDAEALATELNRLIADPDARRQLSEAGFEAAATTYSWDEIGLQTKDLYSSLLGSSGDHDGA